MWEERVRITYVLRTTLAVLVVLFTSSIFIIYLYPNLCLFVFEARILGRTYRLRFFFFFCFFVQTWCKPEPTNFCVGCLVYQHIQNPF